MPFQELVLWGMRFPTQNFDPNPDLAVVGEWLRCHRNERTSFYRGSSVPVTDTGRALQPIGLHGLTAVTRQARASVETNQFGDR